MTKPKVLYHGSQNKNIEIFHPLNRTTRDPSEGPIIFATPDKVIAAMFIVPTNDSWTHSGLFGEVPFYVCSDENKFRTLDTGGAIYTFDAVGFEYDPSKGLRGKEWTNKKTVKPIAEEEVVSALDTMIDLGVQVYFVDKETFKKIDESTDHGNEILRNTISENMKQQKNVKDLPVEPSLKIIP